MKNNSKQKEITLNDIAELIKTSANETTRVLEAKIESSASELATMTQNQFLELGQRIGNMQNNIKDIKSDTKEIKANLNKKVDKIDHNTLTYQVEKLEKKFA